MKTETPIDVEQLRLRHEQLAAACVTGTADDAAVLDFVLGDGPKLLREIERLQAVEASTYRSCRPVQSSGGGDA